jgi:YVTN family beta-propeller protein
LIDDFPPPPVPVKTNQAQVAGATRSASGPATNVVMSLMPFPRRLLFHAVVTGAQGGTPTPLACDPQNQTHLLIPESKRDSLAFLNTCPLQIVARVQVGTKPVNVKRIPDTSRVLVANSGSASLSVVDTATQMVTNTIPLPSFNGAAAQPSAMAIQPDGSLAYVSLHLAVPASVVYIIDLTTMQYTGKMLPVGAFPASMALTPDGSQLWVSSRGDSRVDVFDTSTNTNIFAFNVQLATGVTINPTGTRAFMAEGISPGDVIVIDVQTFNRVAIIPVGNFPHAVKVTSTGRHLFVTNALSNSISLVDAVNNKVLRTIHLRAKHPLGLAFVGKAPF